MKEFEVTVSVANNLIKERRLALGLSRAEVARKAGIGAGVYGKIEKLKSRPVLRTGGWTRGALAIAKFFNVQPDELFPASVLLVENPESTFTADGAEMLQLTGAAQRALLPPGDPEAVIASAEVRGVLDSQI